MAGRSVAQVLARLRRVLVRAESRQRRRHSDRTPVGRFLTAVVCMVASLLVVVSALNARGIDLRPGRNTDLVSLVQSHSRRNADLARDLTALRADVDALSVLPALPSPASAPAELAEHAGLEAVVGPAVTVTLDDAPESVIADGVEPDYLVVHQQDIQAVANAFWEGGAEAMTIQGQRVISTTAIKCVGNTVVLHGIPYAPPYVISAIGDPGRLQAALRRSKLLEIYSQYVEAYGLLYAEEVEPRVLMPAHEGALELQYATVPGPSSPGGTPSR